MGLWPNKYNIKELNNILLANSEDNPQLPNGSNPTKNLASSFTGTVWKTPTDDTPPRKLYEPGDGEKVALLKNWREVFRSLHPGVGRLRMMRKVGDSSDMAPPRGARKMDTSSDDTSAASSLENLRETGVGSDGSKTTTPVEESLSPPLAVHSSRMVESASDLPVNSKMLEHEFPIEGHESYDDPMGMVTEESEMRSIATKVQHSSPKKTKSSAQPARTRKRKASDALDQPDSDKSQDTAEATSRPRSKKITSKKVGETADPPPAPSGSVRRSARNKAK
jgi:hypothetical protein